MERKKVRIETVKLDPSNPRSITKEKFEELKKSIKDFPEMEVVKPLIIADDFVIGGNMRLLAYKDLGVSRSSRYRCHSLVTSEARRVYD